MALGSIGWGYFDIPVTMFFRKETGKVDPFTYTWPLSFEGKGKSKKFKFTFDATKILPLLDQPDVPALKKPVAAKAPAKKVPVKK